MSKAWMYALVVGCAGWYVAGCRDTTQTPAWMVSVTPVAADAQCPAGGVLIESGADFNFDHVLEPDEVSSSQTLCNGQNGAAGTPGATDGGTGATAGAPGPAGVSSLVWTTPLPTGDSHCPAGGVQIDTGLDDGANGGIAGDGVLQPGEVRQTQYVCNGENGTNGTNGTGGTTGTTTGGTAGTTTGGTAGTTTGGTTGTTTGGTTGTTTGGTTGTTTGGTTGGTLGGVTGGSAGGDQGDCYDPDHEHDGSDPDARADAIHDAHCPPGLSDRGYGVKDWRRQDGP